jgi:cation:H+ antiporter
MIHPLILFLLALVLLYVGGEILVNGAVSISKKLNISTLVIGLTIVSFATSAPELFVCLKAAISANSDIVFGNIIGSNIANLALVLGVTAVIFRVKISVQTIGVNFPFLFFSTLVFSFFLYFLNGLSHLIGFLLILFLMSFITYLIKTSENEKIENLEKENDRSIFWNILYIISGVFLLKYGADWLIDGTIFIAKFFNVSDRVIAVTAVAIGTSIPELVTSIIAALRKEENLAVGNLIGSNIFNLLAVLGITSLFVDLQVNDNQILKFDIPFMLFTTSILGLMIYRSTKYVITRKEGLILLFVYFIYILYSIIN